MITQILWLSKSWLHTKRQCETTGSDVTVAATLACYNCSVARFKLLVQVRIVSFVVLEYLHYLFIFHPNSIRLKKLHATKYILSHTHQRTVRETVSVNLSRNTYDGTLHRFRSTKLWITPDGVRGYSFKTTLSSTMIVFGWTNILRGWKRKKKVLMSAMKTLEKTRYQERTSFFRSTISLISPSQPWMGLVRLL